MATLPDLQTDNISVVCYWNATNHGVSSISPTDVLSSSNIDSYTQYDNGVEGEATIETTESRNLQFTWNFRVKSDGWFVVWKNRGGDTYGTDLSESEIGGTYDIIPHCINAKSGDTDVGNQQLYGYASDLFPRRLVDYLHRELGNSSSINFSHADVGVYNYEYPDATNLTWVTNTDNQDTTGDRYTFSYSSSTERLYHSLSHHMEYQLSPSSVVVKVDGSTITSGILGARDALASDIATSSGTTYSSERTDGGGGGGNIKASDYMVTFWK